MMSKRRKTILILILSGKTDYLSARQKRLVSNMIKDGQLRNFGTGFAVPAGTLIDLYDFDGNESGGPSDKKIMNTHTSITS